MLMVELIFKVFFLCKSLCICSLGFIKSRMLNHKIDYVIKCTFMKLEQENVTIGNTEDENETSNCLFDKLYLLKDLQKRVAVDAR